MQSLSLTEHGSRFAAGLCKVGFVSGLFLRLMAAQKGKTVVKIGMRYGKLTTDARILTNP